MLINFSNFRSSLLSCLCCIAFCFGAFALQVTLNTSVMGQDALEALNGLGEPTNETDKFSNGLDALSREVGEPSNKASAPTEKSLEDQKRAEFNKQWSDVLFKELDRLVPGGLVDGSPGAEAMRSAAEAYVQRKNDVAFVILEQAVAANSNFPPAELLMAGLHVGAKNSKDGLRLLQAAAVKAPENPAVYAAYGRLASGANRNVDAKVHFEKLLALMNQAKLDKVSVAYYEKVYLEGMSKTALQLKDYEQARRLGGQLLERDPENAGVLQLMSTVAFQEGKLDEALVNLTKLRDMNPRARVPEAVIGIWFIRSGNKAKAAEWFNKLPAKYADDAAAQLEYADWALAHEDIEGAVTAIAKAESIGELAEAAKTVSNSLKGKIAFYQQNFDEAVAIFKGLHEANPKNSDFSNMYVLSMIESSSSENKALANDLANANLKANPNNRVALASLGYIRLRTLGINDQLKSVFAKVAQTRTQQEPSEVDYFLANFLRELGNDKSAYVVLQQATKREGLFLYRRRADQMKQTLAALLSAQPKP